MGFEQTIFLIMLICGEIVFSADFILFQHNPAFFQADHVFIKKVSAGAGC
jgi:hypothetical protein